ncbi:MAG: hypothetical protein REI09_09355 [Candidatus Dactylopiibacterium sp.]|nr:hypothetical protein [Candidatus Dactylopiibacterium sp.]
MFTSHTTSTRLDLLFDFPPLVLSILPGKPIVEPTPPADLPRPDKGDDVIIDPQQPEIPTPPDHLPPLDPLLPPIPPGAI